MKELFGFYNSRGITVHDHHSRKHDRRQAGMVLEQQLNGYTLIHKQKSEKDNLDVT